MNERNVKPAKEGANYLFRNIRKGDKTAFEKLFKKFYPRLYAFAFKVVRNKEIAEDIVQDIFIRLWEKKENIKPVNIEGFIFKVLKNQCISYLRNIKILDNINLNLNNLAHIEELYRIDFLRNEPYVLVEKELQLEIDSIINKLPYRCKEVFILSRLNGLKNREIAHKLGINIKNVERHISKALVIFKTQFRDKILLSLLIIVSIYSNIQGIII
jgi:RNA polymerase sigma-70 factor (ECF subfamily)